MDTHFSGQISGERTILQNQSKRKQKFIGQLSLFFLLLPGLIWYIIFKYIPMLNSYIAFTDEGTKRVTSFIGIDNFKDLYASPDFINAFFNTLIISGYILVFFFPLPIILSLLLNEVIFIRLRRLVQFIVYIPHFFSWVVIGSVFAMLLSPQSGIINQFITAIGAEPTYFMADPKWFRSVLVSSYIWRDVGYATIIYIATISTIDLQLYEAATVDGAGFWGKMWYITIPALKPTIATVLLLTVARILLIFEQVLVMYTPPVLSVSEVLTTYSYSAGLLNGNMGYAAAISLFTAVVSAILVILCNQISKIFLDKSII